ncbi:phosphomevalonate kinase [Martiniozyma asiatica (nom. inval.)]|nr:phosphomevalonate kinase [Martiniozyma asiatica]
MVNVEQNHRAFSATGKAILAGGYLVLDPKYKAFVIALSARMHALTHFTNNEKSNQLKISVKSPQFKDGCWSYVINVDQLINNNDYRLLELENRRNPFVESTIGIILKYAYAHHLPIESKNIEITIFSDAEYHSQINSIAKKSNNDSFNFLYHKLPITEVSKTGLGSSAGLVTCLTAAFLSCYFKDFNVSNTEWKQKVHNLAQISHCKAQGKIGSGFDVASATFGSIIYKRFSPKLIDDLLLLKNNEFIRELKTLIDDTNWEMVHDSCCMPKGIRLLMGDVQGGSETPKLVSKVLGWKKENPERANFVWSNLDKNNMNLAECLVKLRELSVKDSIKYDKLLQYLECHNGKEIAEQSEYPELAEIANTVLNIRKYLKIMTNEAGAEIEPEEQTVLLNSCAELNGVLGGVVPGAGGYDAICLLVGNNSIESIIKNTKKGSEDTRFDKIRWMDLQEQHQGLIEEKIIDFDGLY